MFSNFKDWLIRFVTSRFFILSLLVIALCSTLVYRLFDLQIVRGESYMENFRLRIRKERSIASTRGQIFDRNGNVLAYNELAYSVIIEDVYESGSTKNEELNETISRLIRMIEQNGDAVINDFSIVIDEDGKFSYTVTGNVLLRFLADIYGHSSINDLSYAEKTATPDEVMEYLGGRSRFGVGRYLYDPDGNYLLDENGNRQFLVGDGYTKEELLKIVTIRYAMSLNSYQKYIPTTVATNVSEETIVAVMENSDVLDGVSIFEDTVRKYVDAVYFSNLVGYTGKISSEELVTYQEQSTNYTSNDLVGKTGIEQSMELRLQGVKGSEVVYVDNLGRVIETAERTEPTAGEDIYLTIDMDLQETAYHILEQKIAGILLVKIQNIKEYIPAENASASQIVIPIYDVYFALFDNNVLKMRELDHEDATETESIVYANYLDNKDIVLERLRTELLETGTVYNKLETEYAVYESYIVAMLQSDNVGVLRSDLIDTSDATYKAWRNDETISLREYLHHAISMNWIDTSRLPLDDQYADSEEVYAVLVDYILSYLGDNTDFGKRMIKYMILNDRITGKQICQLLIDKGLVNLTTDELNAFANNAVSPYQFMRNRIQNLDITPAQLALDPCTGDMVITDVNTGDVLAMVSYPGYDTNRVSDAAYWNKINTDLSYPMLNYTTQRRTAPGSTFKMVSASAALEEGYLTTQDRIVCHGIFDRLDAVNRCWIYPGAHGSLNVTGAISNSCNCFFYEAAYRMSLQDDVYSSDAGITVLAKYAQLFGLGDKSGVEIEESAPRVSDEYPVITAIGQGNANYSTAQLARYVTTVANSGTCYNLTLIDRIEDSEGNVVQQNQAHVRNTLNFSDSTWDVIHMGMRQVIEGKRYYAGLEVQVAGKTGTAQESRTRPNHALFVCYAPYESPEIAIATRIEYGYTSDYAAETTRDVIKYYFGLATKETLVTGMADGIQASGVSTD
ncbi:MAG: penicillin-binding transpeptidase domain-containing protein [Clostridium sp.]|nr:penicillin-binding transpeptidase domain-containing protein [Clostridium sp.]